MDPTMSHMIYTTGLKALVAGLGLGITFNQIKGNTMRDILTDPVIRKAFVS